MIYKKYAAEIKKGAMLLKKGCINDEKRCTTCAGVLIVRSE
jgi:hypothetical protein